MSDSILPPPRRLFPTAARPLLGLTVLVVEDSRFASEAIRLMCLRSGARIRRADCLKSARRHLAAYRPSVAIVDLGLPDGSGEDLIRELAGSNDPVAVLLATSGDETCRSRALAAGAQAFLAKPVETLGAFQEAILQFLPSEARPQGLRQISTERLTPDPMSFRDDMLHIASLVDDAPDARALTYIARFLEGVGLTAKDATLIDTARNLARAADTDADPDMAGLRKVLSDRIAEQATI